MKKLLIFEVVVLLIVMMSNSCDPFFEGEGTLVIQNTSTDLIIWYVYIREAGTLYWGADQLGGIEEIEIGDSRSFTLAAGDYDVQVVDDDLWAFSAYDVTIDGGSTTTLTYDGGSLE